MIGKDYEYSQLVKRNASWTFVVALLMIIAVLVLFNVILFREISFVFEVMKEASSSDLAIREFLKEMLGVESLLYFGL